jgi:hypothetical protein
MAVREDSDRVTLAGELHGGGNRIEVAGTPAHRKDPEPRQQGRNNRMEELRLPHPPHLPREQAVGEREPVEIRKLI